MKEVTAILEAEQEAVHILARAEKEREKIVSAAKQQALARITAMKKETDAHFDTELKRKEQQFQKGKQEILAKAEAEAVRIKNAAQKRLAKAEQLLFEKIVRVDTA